MTNCSHEMAKLEIDEKTNNGDEEEEISPVLYLTDDMWSVIMSRLCLKDQIQVRSSCRSWLSLCTGTAKPHLKLPWIFIYSDDLSSYFLYNPYTGNSRRFQATFPNICPAHGGKNRVRVLASRSGWLLMTFPCCLGFAFLFNPFTSSTLELPTCAAVPSNQYWSCSSYAFDYCPVEQRVTVYSARIKQGFAKVTVWSTGERTWKYVDTVSVTYDRSGIEWANLNLICAKGVLYCYFSREKLVVFRGTSDGGFKRIELPLPQELLPEYRFMDTSSLYLSGGDLYVVSMHGFTNRSRTCTWHAARLDLAERNWVFEESKEKAYFYTNENTLAVVVSEPCKEFAGRFVGALGRVHGVGRYIFMKTPVSHIPNGVGKPMKNCGWSFPWPCELLSHYVGDQFRNLNVLWIETPTI